MWLLPGQHSLQQPDGLGRRPSRPRELGVSLPGRCNPSRSVLVVVLMGSGASQRQALS